MGIVLIVALLSSLQAPPPAPPSMQIIEIKGTPAGLGPVDGRPILAEAWVFDDKTGLARISAGLNFATLLGAATADYSNSLLDLSVLKEPRELTCAEVQMSSDVKYLGALSLGTQTKAYLDSKNVVYVGDLRTVSANGPFVDLELTCESGG